MISAQGTHRVDYIIHLPQLHAVHLQVEFVEIFLDGAIVHPVGFCVGFIEQYQYRIAVSEIWRIFCDIGSQFLKIVFQSNHLQGVVMLTPSQLNYKWLDSPKVYETFIHFDSIPEKEPVVFC